MTCQECEIKLGMGEDASEHVASCEECRWLAEELRLNSHALHEMRVRPRLHWEWALAAAAAIVMAVSPVEKLPMPPVRVAVAPAQAVYVPASHKKARPRAAHGAAPQPLRVKMFTSDPDVVIYWIVDKKEGTE
jgi:hypothetical protein